MDTQVKDHDELVKINSLMTKVRDNSIKKINQSDSKDSEEYYKGAYDVTMIVMQEIDKYLFSDHDAIFRFIVGGY